MLRKVYGKSLAIILKSERVRPRFGGPAQDQGYENFATLDAIAWVLNVSSGAA